MDNPNQDLIDNKNLAGCCGLFCGLCPRFQSKAPSRCFGCHLTPFTNSWCSIYRCCVKKKRYHTCAECADYPCSKFMDVLGMERDSFISHKPAKQNILKIKEDGLKAYLTEQRERRVILEKLLNDYNSGKEGSFSCLVCALLKPEQIREGIEKVEIALAKSEFDLKQKAKIYRAVFTDLAKDLGIELKLRRIKR